MKFCPECKSIIIPKKVDGKNIIKCACGYEEKDAEDLKFASKGKNTEIKDAEVMSNSDEQLPTTKSKCEKCANEEAYYWEIQTRASDEPPTRFYRCTKCKYTWRDYS